MDLVTQVLNLHALYRLPYQWAKSRALPFSPRVTLKIRLPKPCADTLHALDPHKQGWQTEQIDLLVDD